MISRFQFLLAFSLVASCLAAQDSRTVIEPLFPQLCTTLDAQLSTDGHSLAAADEQKLDTARLQRAIDKCGRGRAVMLRVDETSNAFLTGPLVLKPDVTLIIGRGVTLFASRDPAVFAVSPGSCGIVSHSPGLRGCKPLISVDHAPNSGVMGDGVIDGRGGEKMLGSQYSWWDLAEQARAGGGQQVPRLIVATDSDNFTLYRITLKNSPNFHVVYNHGDGFTVWGLKIDTPQRLARNTDGVDPGDGAKNVTITHSYIRAGDDNVAIKGGPGGATNMTISHDHFYWGHGMSIGSETNGGVSQVLVRGLSLDGPDNGIRIKSNATRGGLVQGVLYDDICIRNSKYPILFDTAYSFPGKGVQLLPVYDGITLRNVRISGGGRLQFNGFDHTHRISVTLDGVLLLDKPSLYKAQAIHTDLTFGPGPVNPVFTGDDSIVTGKEVGGALPACTAKFVPFPAQ